MQSQCRVNVGSVQGQCRVRVRSVNAGPEYSQCRVSGGSKLGHCSTQTDYLLRTFSPWTAPFPLASLSFLLACRALHTLELWLQHSSGVSPSRFFRLTSAPRERNSLGQGHASQHQPPCSNIPDPSDRCATALFPMTLQTQTKPL